MKVPQWPVETDGLIGERFSQWVPDTGNQAPLHPIPITTAYLTTLYSSQSLASGRGREIQERFFCLSAASPGPLSLSLNWNTISFKILC